MPKRLDPLWFAFHKDALLLLPDTAGIRALPCAGALPCPTEEGSLTHDLGEFQGHPCRAVALAEMAETAAPYAPAGLRASYEILGEDLYTLAGKGAELIHWDRRSRFCPVCASPMVPHSPISKRCPACGNEMFPAISPAIIVLIRKGDDALLVRGHSFRGNMHGLVAGFLEPGETLEECVVREVKEETGLDIAAIRYFGSQPWPYPSGLMVGFTAEYAGGDIVIQEEELASAQFFARDNLPELPAKLSIARKLIDAWLNGEV